MSTNHDFSSTVSELFKGMDNFITTKTVVGEPTQIGDVILLPLVDASFGVGAGAFGSNNKSNAGGGMTGKVTPSAVLVIKDGETKLVNIKNQQGVTKLLDMAPDVLNKFSDMLGAKSGSDSVKTESSSTVDEILEGMED